jgi:Fe2+ or Zn2+ uptake regulation protein
VPSQENATTPRWAILKHLLQNPRRGYTLEEIAEWWLMTKKVIEAAEEIKRALRYLCEEEMVSVRHETKTRRSFYRINPQKVPDIQRLLDENETG